MGREITVTGGAANVLAARMFASNWSIERAREELQKNARDPSPFARASFEAAVDRIIELRSDIRNCHYNVAWDEGDGIYVASVDEHPLLKAHGDTQEAALREMRRAVCLAFEDMEGLER